MDSIGFISDGEEKYSGISIVSDGLSVAFLFSVHFQFVRQTLFAIFVVPKQGEFTNQRN